VILLIGAGCSVSAGVPLASEIAKSLVVDVATDCGAGSACKESFSAYSFLAEKEASRFGFPKVDAVAQVDWSRVYDAIFQSHYASNDDQHRIFGSLTDPAKIGLNWSHLCLGELVRAGFAGTVLTTNFDQLILEGMIAAGVLPVICDGLESLNRIVSNPTTPQLVHIHGSRHAYRLMNDPRVLAESASDPRIVGALTPLLQAANLFVAIGYGGRERSFMTALTEAAKNFPDKSLFWVQHSANPAELGDQPKAFLASSRNARLIVGQDSDEFFAALMKELGVEAPLMIRDPLALASSSSARIQRARRPDAIRAVCAAFEQEVVDLGHALGNLRAKRSDLQKAILDAQELDLKGDDRGAFERLLPHLDNLRPDAGAELLASILRDSIADLPQAEARKALRHLWSTTKNDDIRYKLAAASRNAGDRWGDSDLLEDAIAEFRRLIANPAGATPKRMTDTKVYLGIALFTLGERESSSERLMEAVEAYREALKEYDREQAPLDWAMTQNNLGNALSSLGERESGTDQLMEAAKAYREALKEFTRERVPLNWAMTQNNLGATLETVGERENSTAGLEEAVSVYREALKEYTRERVPLDWAMTQNNLGGALFRLGERESGPMHLEEAVAALRAALEEFTRERVPLYWATTQNTLGAALQALGLRKNSTAELEQAVVAFREALKERTRERVPLNWAATQNNLGTVLVALGRRESGAARLEEGIAAYSGALEVYNESKATYYIDLVKENLARAEALLAERRKEASK
jgi:tetratricopeptide (TPR) repeat protein